jgi:N-acetyl sugar amidotransferase
LSRAVPLQICTFCVMDTSDPEIRFDEAGRCHHCSGQVAKIARLRVEQRYGSEHLPALLERMRRAGAGRRYDAVLGISGGVDSAFLALSLKALGLRLLLVHVDNGWDTHQAATNIRKVAEATGFDYRSYVLDWKEFRGIQLAFLKASVVEAETPTDIALAGALHRAAASEGIAVLASASNEASEGILPRLWHYNSKDMRYFRHIVRSFGGPPLRRFPAFGFATELYEKAVRGVRIVYPLNFLDFDRRTAVATLRDRIGWRDYGGKHHESHYTRFVQSFLLPTKFGLDYRKATLSSLICVGQATREEALAELERPPFEEKAVEEDKSYVALKLGLSSDELEAILARPGRYYHAFPNNERLLSAAYRLFKAATGRRT